MVMPVREIEIRIERADEGLWRAGMRLADPANDLESVLVEPVDPALDIPALIGEADRDAYGRMLWAMLFGESAAAPLYAAFRRARAMTGGDQALRVRLSIGADAPQLHGIRWETLCD